MPSPFCQHYCHHVNNSLHMCLHASHDSSGSYSMAGSEGEAGAGHSAGKQSAARTLASTFHVLLPGRETRHSKGVHII